MATCATPILNATRAGEHTDFPQKNAAATIYFSANAIRGLFKDGYYSKYGVYSKNSKRGRAQPSFKARSRAIVYGSWNWTKGTQT